MKRFVPYFPSLGTKRSWKSFLKIVWKLDEIGETDAAEALAAIYSEPRSDIHYSATISGLFPWHVYEYGVPWSWIHRRFPYEELEEEQWRKKGLFRIFRI